MRGVQFAVTSVAASATALVLVAAAASGQVVGASVSAKSAEAHGTAGASASVNYVALGDSFSAGVGTFDPSTEPCYRSPLGFPARIADGYGWTLDDRSCDGATTLDVMAGQTAALGADTGAVTVTAGGNDVGFSVVVAACALPSWLADCTVAVNRALTTARTVLPARLTALYGTIRAKAPNASVVVAGYPRLFGASDCNLVTFFTSGELRRLNQATDTVVQILADRADRAGVRFADVRDAFSGHAVCGAAPWVNDLSWPLRESFHPNRAGHQAYAGVVGPALVPNAPQRLVMPLPGRPGRDSDEPVLPSSSARQLTGLADLLVVPANLNRAQRLGIPRATVLRLEKALRSGTGPTAAAALRELRALDRQVEARLR